MLRRPTLPRALAPLLLLSILGGLGACKKPTPTPEENIASAYAILEKHRAAIEGVKRKLDKVQELDKQKPPLKALEAHPGSRKEVVPLDADTPVDQADYPGGCVTQFSRRWYIELLEGKNKIRSMDDYMLPTFDADASELEQAKWAVVCAVRDLVPPILDAAHKSYKAGAASVECRLYALEGPRYVGGFTARAVQGGDVEYQGTDLAAKSRLDMELKHAVNQAAEDALIPGGKATDEWFRCDLAKGGGVEERPR